MSPDIVTNSRYLSPFTSGADVLSLRIQTLSILQPKTQSSFYFFEIHSLLYKIFWHYLIEIKANSPIFSKKLLSRYWNEFIHDYQNQFNKRRLPSEMPFYETRTTRLCKKGRIMFQVTRMYLYVIMNYQIFFLQHYGFL